jgi:hypothetical protein
MSQMPFVRDEKKVAFGRTPELPIIGRLARVKLQDHGVRRAIARIDSGATNSSIDASDIHIKNGELHFTLFNKNNPIYTGKEFTTRDFKNTNMRNTTSQQERYTIVLKFELGGKVYDIPFALADRSNMLYPILIGRNFLNGRYTVDTSKQFIEQPIKKIKRK